MRLADPQDKPVLPGLSREGISTREQSIHRAAETEEIGAGVNRSQRYLLGRHEIVRPDHNVLVRIEDVAPLSGHPDELTKAKIEHLHDPGIDEEQVGGLDVAMNHALLVRV